MSARVTGSLLKLALGTGLAGGVTVAQALEFETVNERPQFTHGENHFLFYWAVWARLTPAERQFASQPAGAQLLSRRISRWESHGCEPEASTPIKTGREDLYLFDEIELDDAGLVQPIREAQRPDYRYFVVASINGWQLRRAEAAAHMKRARGEDSDLFDARKEKAWAEWEAASTPRGTRGFAEVELETRLLGGKPSTVTPAPGDSATEAKAGTRAEAKADTMTEAKAGTMTEDLANFEFFRLGDYRSLSPERRAQLETFAPSRWPFYYDERAHKPHSLVQPMFWAHAHPTNDQPLRMRFNWNWCTGDRARVVMTVPLGSRPAPGPNRVGRTDSGEAAIEMVETIDWQADSHWK